MRHLIAMLLLAAIFTHRCLYAEGRLFATTYEAEVPAQGTAEFEQAVTNLSGHATGVFSRWKLAEELEYGFTPRVSGAIYLNFNQVYSSLADPLLGTQTQAVFAFDGVSTEWKYLLLDGDHAPLAMVAYFEARYSGAELELEPKLIVSKDLGEHWALALNLAPATEYGYSAEGQSMQAELSLSAGLAWKHEHVSVGLEALNQRWRPDWGDESGSVWYAGPDAQISAGRWALTLAVLPQVQGQPNALPGDGRALGTDDQAKLMTRLLLSVDL